MILDMESTLYRSAAPKKFSVRPLLWVTPNWSQKIKSCDDLSDSAHQVTVTHWSRWLTHHLYALWWSTKVGYHGVCCWCVESTKQASKVTFLYNLFLPFLCFISNTVMVERSKHLNPQNSIEQEKKQQEDGDTPDLFPGSPAKQKRWRKAYWNFTCRTIYSFWIP